MSNPDYDVTWLVTPDADLYDASKLISGFCELQKEGVIRFRIAGPDQATPGRSNPLYLQIESFEGCRRRIAVDLHDRGDLFYQTGLSVADAYFKRCFDSREAAKQKPGIPIKPFGLNFACLSRSATGAFLRAAIKKALVPAAFGLVPRARHLVQDLRLLHGLPDPEAFCPRSNETRDPIVLFQTRVWASEPDAPDWSGINMERAMLVRTLRRALGDRFVGGLIADDFARAAFPDILAQTNTHRAAYAELTRTATIGVYTRGLHDSLAFKLAEYLAAGLCIVSEPLKFELPVPLLAGVHFLPFETHDQCVAQCIWLLEHPTDATRMRHANLDYYQKYVAPRNHARDIIERSFE